MSDGEFYGRPFRMKNIPINICIHFGKQLVRFSTQTLQTAGKDIDHLLSATDSLEYLLDTQPFWRN